MPELPDVETFRRYFNRTALHNKIQDVTVNSKKVLDDISEQSLKKKLTGRTFESTDRRGKYLFAVMDNDKALVFHFGMTGYFEYYKDDKDLKHDRVIIDFENGYHLAFVCQRMLGKVTEVDSVEEFAADNDIGPDALSVDINWFTEHFGRKRGSLKSAFMDQSLMAGLGNIYTDEVLFHAKYHPKQPVNKLDKNDLETLFETMKEVLDKAIDKQADPDQMPDSFLLPHRGTSDSCPRCGGDIKKQKISGRSAYFCPSCQKIKK